MHLSRTKPLKTTGIPNGLALLRELDVQTFDEVAAALREIRDKRLYRGTHATFETYAAERFGIPPTILTLAMRAADEPDAEVAQ